MKFITFLNLWFLLFATAISSNAQTIADNSDATQQAQTDSLYVRTDSVYEKVDKIAEFPGGINAMMGFMSKNFHYPNEAQIKNIQGRVVIKYIVNADGKISDAKVVNSVHPLLDEEALRIISLMPDWIPAKIGDIPVRSYFFFPVTFRLHEGTLNKKKK